MTIDMAAQLDIATELERKIADGFITRNYEWVCNECNFPNFTSSVSEDEIEQELHACINCGCFEFHKRHCR